MSAHDFAEPAPGLLVGIDFTSAPTLRKPITVAHGRFAAGTLRLEQVVPHADFDGFARWLAEPGSWVGAFDFPFGLPRELVLALGWPTQWAS